MQPMPSLMPSLLKYFTIVGGVLVLALISINAVLEPGGPGPRIVKDQPKTVAIRHDPRASLVERLRAEEAAREAAAKGEAQPQAVTVGASAALTPAPQPVIQAAAPAQPVIQAVVPAQPETVAKPDLTAPAALTSAPSEDEAAQAVRHAKEQMKVEKARKKRLARARAKALEEASASRQQDQIYYGYAPRPTYGPFGQVSGWQGGGWAQRW